MDPVTGLCDDCYTFCSTCTGNAVTCGTCKTGYFREFMGTSCVDVCPTGMYGNYKTQ